MSYVFDNLGGSSFVLDLKGRPESLLDLIDGSRIFLQRLDKLMWKLTASLEDAQYS